MTRITKPINTLLNRVHERFRRNRAGSVLILVVALLVLMALLGTAYISTTRIDRYSSAQHTANVQVDLLIESVVVDVEAALRRDLFDAGGRFYRPADNGFGQPSGYDNYDSPFFGGPVDTRPRASDNSLELRNNMPDDGFLAQRIPEPLDISAPFGLTNPAVWRGVTYPLSRSAVSDVSGKNYRSDAAVWKFDFPAANNISATTDFFFDLRLPHSPSMATGNNTDPIAQQFTGKVWFKPTSIEIPKGGPNAKKYPAFLPYLFNPGVAPPTLVPLVGGEFLAADADGDGVADSGLVKMPVGVINGITYYYALRIVDNGSAVNFNTAWSNMEFNGAGMATQVTPSPYPGRYYTPASVGLAEMLRTTKLTGTQVSAINKGDEMYALMDNWTQWFGTRAFPITGVYGTAAGAPIADDGTSAIAGFRYQSLQEALYATLGARMSNPGYVDANIKAQPFSVTDSVALAYHNTLVNPDASPSPLETLFVQLPTTDSIYRAADNYNKKFTSYTLTDAEITKWFARNFDYLSESPLNQSLWLNRRALMVSSNPVSMQAPVQTISDAALNSGLQLYVANGGVSQTKTSINHATHPELWRAFWNVIAEPTVVPDTAYNFPGEGGPGYAGSPFELRMMFSTRAAGAAARTVSTDYRLDPPTFNNPYLGSQFDAYAEPAAGPYGYDPYVGPVASRFNPLVAVDDPALPVPTDYHPARQFRSCLRAVPSPDPALTATGGFGNGTPRLNAHQMVLLRSALAAVNAQDLRDSDDNITAQRIVLNPTRDPLVGGVGVPTQANAILYGAERQPFITEVYVDTDTEYTPGGGVPVNPYGYVAIELYNPYDQDIVLTNWKLAAIDRRSSPTAAGSPNPPFTNDGASTPPVTRVAAPGALPMHNLPLDETTIIADFDPNYDVDIAAAPDVYVASGPWAVGTPSLVVPAKGYLLLENHYEAGMYAASAAPPPAGAAGHRPPQTGLPLQGAILGANAGNDRSTGTGSVATARPGMPRLNVACVPGLSGVVDAVGWMPAEWPTGIRSVLNRELVILRPRRSDGQYSTGVYPKVVRADTTVIAPEIPYNEIPNVTGSITPPLPGEVSYSHLRDLVPVDSFDFTNCKLPQPVAGGVIPPAPLGRDAADPLVNTAVAWHYSRQNVDDPAVSPASETQPSNWKMVYPGRYWASLPVAASVPPTTATFPPDFAGSPTEPRPRLQGTQFRGWGTGAGNPFWIAGPPVECSFGIDITTGAIASNGNPVATFPTAFKVPLGTVNNSEEVAAGITNGTWRNTVGSDPLSYVATAQNKYPYGGFGRDGDILQVPFIGSYTIRYLNEAAGAGAQTGSVYSVAEINPVTIDSAFAEDTDTQDDPITSGAAPPQDDTLAGAFGYPEREQLGRFIPIRTLTRTSTDVTVPDYSSSTGYPNINFTAVPTPYATANQVAVNDFGHDPSWQPAKTNAAPPNFLARGADWEPFWRYRFAYDIFDYLTVKTPSDDYLPNVPAQNDWVQNRQYRRGDFVSYFNPDGTVYPVGHYIFCCNVAAGVQATAGLTPFGDGNFDTVINCKPVSNEGGVPAIRGGVDAVAHGEDHVPVEGLVNINSAGWKVLATLPLVVNPATGFPDDQTAGSTGFTYRQLNQHLAQAITYWRDVDCNPDTDIVQPHGPFRSIFDLNQVVDLRPNKPGINGVSAGFPPSALAGFQNAYFTLPYMASGTEPNDSLGDLTPTDPSPAPVTDGVRGDYEERMAQLTRISNLITPRSDSFTVYVMLQGWRNAETKDAELVVQRRIGYMIDRSRVTPRTPDKMTKQAFSNN